MIGCLCIIRFIVSGICKTNVSIIIIKLHTGRCTEPLSTEPSVVSCQGSCILANIPLRNTDYSMGHKNKVFKYGTPVSHKI